ncbi:MAG: hypothetical protein VKI82_03525 [Leptolyngbya sp.]|nr:hypothetical protein [Leptolyngbya sp.]
MNRYVLAGAAGLLILLALSGGTSRRSQGQAQMPGEGDTEEAILGTLPIEQAGQVVRRQSAASGTPPAMAAPSFDGTSDFTTDLDSGAGTASTPPGDTPSGGASTLPAPTGDISPVQPDLVRPDPQPPVSDPALDAIPALW